MERRSPERPPIPVRAALASGAPCRGLPIGNQTSQFFANVYLDGLDHFVKEELRCLGYVRYVDDLALFGDDRDGLWAMLEQVDRYLAGLRLSLHPHRRRLAPVSEGVSWVGYRVFPTHIRLRNDNPTAFRRRFTGIVRRVRAGEMTKLEAMAHWRAWEGHARQADTEELRDNVWKRAMSPAVGRDGVFGG